jgi:GNAT superfamily N-acetyltransferase
MFGMPSSQIRTVRPDELERVREIELESGAMFVAIGMADIAAHEPAGAEEFAGALVAVDDGDQPIAFLQVEVVDGCLHIAQVSVARDHARQGIGAALIEHAVQVARREGRPALTLTTFTEVPWNMPYYERLGFAVVAPEDQGPQLAAIVALEAREIPGDHPRVAMRRAVG